MNVVSPLVEDEVVALEQAKSIEERLDALGMELMENAFLTMDKMKQYGKKASKKDIELQEELQRNFKTLCATYQMLKKLGRISNKPNENFEADLLKRVKDKKSSLGAIVTRIDKKQNG